MKHEQELRLRKKLKRKVRPAVEDPASVPMSIYFKIVQYDGMLFKTFTKLSRGFRKHILYHVFNEQRMSESFNQTYQTCGMKVVSR